MPQVRCDMEKERDVQDESFLQDGLPLDEEKTEDIAEQIQDLLEQDKHPAAIELFSQLRPGDQGEIIEGLPLEAQQEILTTLPSWFSGSSSRNGWETTWAGSACSTLSAR